MGPLGAWVGFLLRVWLTECKEVYVYRQKGTAWCSLESQMKRKVFYLRYKGPTWKVCRVTGTQGSGSEQSGAEWSWALSTTQLSSPGLSSGKLPAKFIEIFASLSIAIPASGISVWYRSRYWIPLFRYRTGSGIGLVFIPVLSWQDAGHSRVLAFKEMYKGQSYLF